MPASDTQQGVSPSAYSDLLTEYRSVRNHIGLFNFSSSGFIEIRGKDRIKFLNGLTTNDMNGLSVGKGLYTILPNVKGKIASEGFVFYFPENLLLVVCPDLKDKTLQLLNRYKIGSDARITDAAEIFSLLSLQGPETRNLLKKLIQQPLPLIPPFHYFPAALGGHSVHIIQNGWSGEEGVDILLSKSDLSKVWNFLLNEGKLFGLSPVGTDACETIRIEAGLPVYGKELSEEVLPQEAGLESKAINYAKGCYIGQETIARLHYQGHTNRQLAGLLFVNEVSHQGDQIFSGEKILGFVTSAVFSPAQNKMIAMGYIHRQFVKPGTEVEIDRQGRKIPAVVAGLPFYHAEKKENNGKN